MNRNERTERRALVARVESLEGRISLTSFGTTYHPSITGVTTITLMPNNTNLYVLNNSFNSFYHH